MTISAFSGFVYWSKVSRSMAAKKRMFRFFGNFGGPRQIWEAHCWKPPSLILPITRALGPYPTRPCEAPDLPIQSVVFFATPDHLNSSSLDGCTPLDYNLGFYCYATAVKIFRRSECADLALC